MKYFVEYTIPDPENNPYRGIYNIWYKRWWWSWKTVIKKDHVVEGGIAVVFSSIITPHMKSFHTCVTWSDTRPPREIEL